MYGYAASGGTGYPYAANHLQPPGAAPSHNPYAGVGDAYVNPYRQGGGGGGGAAYDNGRGGGFPAASNNPYATGSAGVGGGRINPYDSHGARFEALEYVLDEPWGEPCTALAADSQQELVWTGHADGRLRSYRFPSMQPYSMFEGHPQRKKAAVSSAAAEEQSDVGEGGGVGYDPHYRNGYGTYHHAYRGQHHQQQQQHHHYQQQRGLPVVQIVPMSTGVVSASAQRVSVHSRGGVFIRALLDGDNEPFEDVRAIELFQTRHFVVATGGAGSGGATSSHSSSGSGSSSSKRRQIHLFDLAYSTSATQATPELESAPVALAFEKYLFAGCADGTVLVCVCARARVCVLACVCACACVCVCVRVRACARARARVRGRVWFACGFSSCNSATCCCCCCCCRWVLWHTQI
jgi:hypothetical protein